MRVVDRLSPTTALLVVDVQNDFCPGGALAVPEGDRVVPVINRVAAAVAAAGGAVFASRDWHPERSPHFADHGGTWPRHCVQNSEGAALHPALVLPPGAVLVTKGDRADSEGYDAFEGHTTDGQPFDAALRARGIRTLLVAGLATDYCVKASVLGARARGLDVAVLEDAVEAVNLQPGDADRALEAMREAGATIVPSTAVLGASR